MTPDLILGLAIGFVAGIAACFVLMIYAFDRPASEKGSVE